LTWLAAWRLVLGCCLARTQDSRRLTQLSRSVFVCVFTRLLCMQKAMHCWLPCDHSSVDAGCAPTKQRNINDENLRAICSQLLSAHATAMQMSAILELPLGSRLHATTHENAPTTKTVGTVEKVCVACRQPTPTSDCNVRGSLLDACMPSNEDDCTN
jgi:hypothetical protein